MSLSRVAAALAVLLPSLALAQSASSDTGDWKQVLSSRLPLYGHRNWIVIADSAYPAQSAPGIETIVSNADHLQVLETVLSALAASRHVTPIIYTDRELKFLDEADAHGISDYRRRLSALLQNHTATELPHEKIIARLAEVSQTFRVLIIKTNFTLPYTSVFLQLDCAYWGPEAERKLRAAMASDR
jgi:L-fucose mutarotase/ribose pyranase (RbsD/FucU family)